MRLSAGLFLAGILGAAGCQPKTALPAEPLPPEGGDSMVHVERAAGGPTVDRYGKSRPPWFLVELRVQANDVVPTRVRMANGHCIRLAEGVDRFLAKSKAGGAVSTPGEVLRLSSAASDADYYAPGSPELCPRPPAGLGAGESIVDYRSAGQDRAVRFTFTGGPTSHETDRLPAELARPSPAAVSTTRDIRIDVDSDPASTPAPQTSLALRSHAFDSAKVHLLGVSSVDHKLRAIADLATPETLFTGLALDGTVATIRSADGAVVQTARGRALLFRPERGDTEEIPLKSCTDLSAASRAGLSWAAFDVETGATIQACSVWDGETHGQVEPDWVQSIYEGGQHLPRLAAGLAGEIIGPALGGVFPASGCWIDPGNSQAQCGFALIDERAGGERIGGERDGSPKADRARIDRSGVKRTTVPESNRYLVRTVASGFLVVPLQKGPYELWRVDRSGVAQKDFVYAALAGTTDGGQRPAGSLALGADGALFQAVSVFIAVGKPMEFQVQRRDAQGSRLVYSERLAAERAKGGPYVVPGTATELVTGGAISLQP